MDLSVVILAAGQGTRMRSALPKVLHPLAGRPLLQHVIDAGLAVGAAATYVVYGHGGEAVPARFAAQPVSWVLQERQRGTGDAVRLALPPIPDHHLVLVLYGDVPLIEPETLRQLVAAAGSDGLGLLTVELDNPYGYGRVVRDGDGRVVRIVEQKDASPAELTIRETNTGLLAVRAGALRRWTAALGNGNAQGEYYLTDVIAMAVADGVAVRTVHPAEIEEVAGVNDRTQLAELERHYQRRRAAELMVAGVTLLDPARFDLRGSAAIGRDVTIDVGVILEGQVTIGDGARIGAYSLLRDCEIGAGAVVHPHSVIEESVVGAECRVGPFARLRPESRLAPHVHIGNFVEVKNSTVGEGSKINHLSYVGDSTVGRRVNVGAGTITCNYDGANKHRTVIEDDAFIGSDTQLVAPVTVGAGATIGAGSTITRDAPAGELTLSRSKQSTLPGWKRPVKKPKDPS